MVADDAPRLVRGEDRDVGPAAELGRARRATSCATARPWARVPTPATTTGRRASPSTSRTCPRSRRPRPLVLGSRAPDGADGSKSTWTGPGRGPRTRATIAPRQLVRAQPPNAHRGERHRCHQGELVDALMGDAVAIGRADAVGDQHHRLAVEQRLGDAVHGARDARTTRDDARTRRTGQLTDDTSHDGGRRLGVGEHEAHAALVHRADDVEVRTTARHAEHERRPGVAPRRHEIERHRSP